MPLACLKDSFGANACGDQHARRRDGCRSARRISRRYPTATCRGIAVSVNAEYASRSRVLQDGDEVGLLPPVSGGTETPPESSTRVRPRRSDDSRAVRIAAEKLVAAAKTRRRRRRRGLRWHRAQQLARPPHRCIWTTKRMKRWLSGRCATLADQAAQISACGT